MHNYTYAYNLTLNNTVNFTYGNYSSPCSIFGEGIWQYQSLTIIPCITTVFLFFYMACYQLFAPKGFYNIANSYDESKENIKKRHRESAGADAVGGVSPATPRDRYRGQSRQKRKVSDSDDDNITIALKFKLLIFLCHLMNVLGVLANTLYIGIYNSCNYLWVDDYFIYDLSYFWQLGNIFLLILFIERLVCAVKDSMFQVSNRLHISLQCLVGVQLVWVLIIVIRSRMIGFWWDDTMNLLWNIERGYFFLVVLVVLFVFVRKFNQLRWLMHSDEHQLILNKIIARQVLLLSITQISALIVSTVYILDFHVTHPNWHVYFAAWTMCTIDIMINCLCLHAYFPHGEWIFRMFGCEFCSNKMIDCNKQVQELKLRPDDASSTQA